MISNNLKRTITRLLPYFYLGIMLVVVFILFFFFLYIGIIGAIVGAIIYGVMYLKNKFFVSSKNKENFFNKNFNTNARNSNNLNKHKGRTFENDEQN